MRDLSVEPRERDCATGRFGIEIEAIYDEERKRRVVIFRRDDEQWSFVEEHFSERKFGMWWIPVRSTISICDTREARGLVDSFGIKFQLEERLMKNLRLTWKMLRFAAKNGRTGSSPKLRDLERAREQLQAAPTAENVQLVREMLGLNEKIRRYKAHTEAARQGKNIDEILSEMIQESWEDSCRRLGTIIRFQLLLSTAFSLIFIVSLFYLGQGLSVLLFMWPIILAAFLFFGASFYLVWHARPNSELREFTRDSLIAHQAGDTEAQQQTLRDFQHKVQVRVDAL